MVRIAINDITPKDSKNEFQLYPIIIRSRIAFTAKLIGLYADTLFIHSGISLLSISAVLMNRRGKVKVPAIPKTVSALLVLSPRASDIPDQARPKNATVNRIRTYPMKPVTGKTPRP